MARKLVQIGAIEDYAGIEADLKELGMKILVHESEHLKCSTIEKWYPAIKERTSLSRVYDALPDWQEILKDFFFPVFINRNRQTNKQTQEITMHY